MSQDSTLNAPGRTLGLAALYAALGYLALALATPGGYATAIFPPAGLALSAVLLQGPRRAAPGLWLGSLALNLWVGHGADQWVTARSFGVAAGIATASLLQALLGAALVRRRVPDPLRIHSAREVVRFLALGGPLACLSAATLGTGTLLLGRAISGTEAPVTWFTWWTGDTLGVLIVAPLVLMAWPRGHLAWRGRGARILGPLALALSVVALLVARVSRREEQRLQEQFAQRTRACVRPFETELHDYEGFLASLSSYVASTPTLDPAAFRSFVKGIHGSAPGFHGLSWCPRVEAAARGDFEARQSALLRAPLRITERGPDGALRPAGERPAYFPVSFIEPLNLNQVALGFDLASEPTRRAALEAALGQGGLRATAPLHLVQSGPGTQGLLLARAVTDEGGRPRGVVTAVFFVPGLVRTLQEEARTQDLVVQVVDRTGGAPVELLGWTGAPAPGAPSSMAAATGLQWGGRHYELRFRPTARFMARLDAWQIWALLATGLLLASMLEASLLVVPAARPQEPEELPA